MNVVVCDDHPMFRGAILRVLKELLPDSQEVEVSSAEELHSYCIQNKDLDLLILDLELKDAHGLALLPEFVPHVSTGVVILSASESPQEIQTAMAAGARGFIPKSTPLPIIRKAIQLILMGGVYIPPQALVAATPKKCTAATIVESSDPRTDRLTERQKEILVLASRGLTNKEIGELLTISANTIKAHLRAIYKELDVTNRTEATMVWMHTSG